MSDTRLDVKNYGAWRTKQHNLPPGITGFLKKDVIIELHPKDQELQALP